MKHFLTRNVYRQYRNAKQYCIRHPKSRSARLFFQILSFAEGIVSPRVSPADTAKANQLWKAIYFLRWGTTPLFRLVTDKPIALDSDDHTWPRGALHDNSSNYNFNLKLYDHFRQRADLRVLDLGCSGGGFVRSVLEDGFLGLGVEGSDISRRLRTGEWGNIPHHLFNCDITSAFTLQSNSQPLTFHCITAWEVLEHIPREKLPVLLENIRRHLALDGIFVASVDQSADGNPLTGAVYHVTLENKTWWLAQFAQAGFLEVTEHPFEVRDYVRGHGMGVKDWDPADGEGFHLVMRRNDS